MKKLLLFSSLLYTAIFAKTAYIYEENVGEKNFFSKLIMENILNKIIIKQKNVTTEYSPSFYIEKYIFQSPHKNFQINLKNKNVLLVKGTVNNKKINIKYKINNPWIQQFCFGLKPFILSQKKDIKFVLISPKNFTLHKIVAIKKNTEFITMQKKQKKAQKIIMKLAGFKSLFWQATLWFDSKGNLLKYKGNDGPNTLTTISTLKEIKKID